MADLRMVFPILADSSTGAGEPAISRIEGEAAAAQEGLIGFSFKDSSGDVVLPQLDSSGRIIVNTEGVDFTCLTDNGESAAGSVGTDVNICTITLTAATVYNDIFAMVSSSRWSRFRIYSVEDVGVTDVESEIGNILVGPGQFTVCCHLICVQFTAGSTGTLELRIDGQNETHASSLRGTLAVKEIS